MLKLSSNTPRSAKFIIAVFATAVVGLIASQIFWGIKSAKLKGEQFNHRVDMTLVDVVEEFRRYQDTVSNYKIILQKEISKNPGNILEIVVPEVLDTLLRKYSVYHHLPHDFVYSIKLTENDSTFYASKNYDAQHKGESHFACLSCLWEEQIFHLELVYPSKTKFIILELIFWISLSAVFTLISILSFSYVLMTYLKQKRIEQIKSDFVNNMTHEFKTPISTIQLSIDVLNKKLRDQEDKGLRNYIEIISKENFKMKNQVNQILESALLSTDHFQLSKENFDLHTLIRQTAQDLDMELKENEGTILFTFEAKNGAIYADKGHIGNMLVNLIQNATKYNKNRPSIELSTSQKEEMLLLKIKDNGLGIHPRDQKQIFDQFFRVSTGNIHDVKGFGLGLYYVKEVVLAHGGEINVHSELGRGTTFQILLPIKT